MEQHFIVICVFIHLSLTLPSLVCARRQGSGEGQSIHAGDRRLDFGSNAVTADVILLRSPALPGPLFPHPQKYRLQCDLYYLQHQHYLGACQTCEIWWGPTESESAFIYTATSKKP